MAQVNIYEILEYYADDVTDVLQKTLKRTVPGASVGRTALYDAFLNEIDNAFANWEQVPDSLVSTE